MDIKSTVDLSWDEFDELRQPRADKSDFDAVVDRAISRRGFLGGVLAFGSGAAVFGSGVLGSATSARAASAVFGFEPIGIAT
ncbi:MAG: transcriptional initiation protein Tat, partial [Pseudomonadota bacterium]|nr:transcriptional initiation protein Tat [Pseudomonadota bacterium]